ncbi:MAG: BrxA/BrxB family bacilliredoxin, partial [Gemmatimonadales bacterium]|nr:BrxA/BrxB family bacilliredoxin [Gemmatimonadales bacterium]
MSYPEMMVKPMREELTRLGVEELRSVEEVDAALGDMQGTALVFVNSVCGCAAGGARPAMAKAMSADGKRPDKVYTVFAGQDLDATARA